MIGINTHFSRYILCFCLLALASVASYAQSLSLVGRVKVEGSGLTNAKVVLFKEGKKVRTIKDNLAKFELKLDLNSSYILSFEKDGYVTKKLEFNTTTPSAMEEKEFTPFGFTVNLFEQYDDVNMVVFNQPVGKIRYESELEEFDYDTDYTKSIQSRLSEAMKEVEQAKKQAAKQAKKNEKEQAKRDAEEQKEQAAQKKREEEELLAELREEEEKNKAATVQKEEIEKASSPVQESVAPKPVEEEKSKPVVSKPVVPNANRAPAQSGSNGRLSITPTEGFESSPVRKAQVKTGYEEQVIKEEPEELVERFEDIIVEKTKIITKVRYEKGDHSTEYLKVYHKWGGTFYFKNGKSCSQNAFELETMGYDLVTLP